MVRMVIRPPGTKHGTQQFSPMRLDSLEAQHSGQQNTQKPVYKNTHSLTAYRRGFIYCNGRTLGIAAGRSSVCIASIPRMGKLSGLLKTPKATFSNNVNAVADSGVCGVCGRILY